MRRLVSRLPFLANRLPSLSMFRRPDQWTWLYPWFVSRRENYLLDHALPFITYDAIAYLKKTLRKDLRVFEYGCGASTLFWAKYASECISIEHDPEWHAVVKARLRPGENVDLRLVSPDAAAPIGDRDVTDPDGYWTDWEQFADRTFRNYASQIDPFPDQYFDVVVVDGQARPSCIKHGVRKVKPGGMLILDNADVPRYLARTQGYLAGFERKSFYGIAPIHGVMSQTDIYLSPSK